MLDSQCCGKNRHVVVYTFNLICVGQRRALKSQNAYRAMKLQIVPLVVDTYQIRTASPDYFLTALKLRIET